MLAGDLLAWGLPRLRDLPWRRTRDPWAVLVSEVMLQQTQVPRVIPKWQAFMAAYPATADCAAAPLGDVLRLWQGLGYPRRARNLHAAAAQVEALGGFPTTLDGLLALPGVGQYTARAVLAFAFEADAAVVDTNIARVHARVAGRRLTSGEVQRAADAALPRGQAWAWNQCLMDLGATVCRPQAPQCAECPLLARCAWHGQGEDPAPGSAGVSRPQARFDGSDRQARGRLLKALAAGPVPKAEIAAVMARPAANAAALADALMAEGLCVAEGDRVRLP
ncbi:MAG: A/G-specific adenine glycosylase [Acidimicrobiaceae bacterium]|nr:A/G-specific adenine glycosylase [Ilumatobacter sp.]MCB9379471.1 A/G-specific adenine glycosylase [Acidimicrobiaceae bacterium]MCO5332238.1 A/G-specific adenine glycosylase [Ilumatobacteraceae bacterium]